MSPTVNNFVHDLVAMAKAMEDLPVVQAQADELARQNGELAHSVQAREESILKLKAEIDALHAKVRSTEAERDDAELRFLELDDRVGKVTKKFQAALEAMDATDKAIETLHPVPTPPAEPEVKHDEPIAVEVAYDSGWIKPPQGQSESSPIPATPTTGEATGSSPSLADGPVSQSTPLPVTSFEEVPKSDANPPQDTASATPIDSGLSATYSGASTTENASVSTTTDSAVDDVGYHNEPDVGNDWSAWNAWCERMHKRYAGAWPMRPDNAASSVA